jgi:hypothetical protein
MGSFDAVRAKLKVIVQWRGSGEQIVFSAHQTQLNDPPVDIQGCYSAAVLNASHGA